MLPWIIEKKYIDKKLRNPADKRKKKSTKKLKFIKLNKICVYTCIWTCI